jgi:hypothetical protein
VNQIKIKGLNLIPDNQFKTSENIDDPLNTSYDSSEELDSPITEEDTVSNETETPRNKNIFTSGNFIKNILGNCILNIYI